MKLSTEVRSILIIIGIALILTIFFGPTTSEVRGSVSPQTQPSATASNVKVTNKSPYMITLSVVAVNFEHMKYHSPQQYLIPPKESRLLILESNESYMMAVTFHNCNRVKGSSEWTAVQMFTAPDSELGVSLTEIGIIYPE